MLVIGAVFVDVKGFPNEKYIPTGTNIGRVEFVHGGVCRNVAENFASLGVDTRFVSMIDDSAMGREVRDRLNGLGVDTHHMLSVDNGMGMWLAILDENGNLAGSVSRQPDFLPLQTYLQARLEEIISECEEDIVIEFDMNETISAHVLNCARKQGRRVYSIVGNMGVILKHPEYLWEVACFICNEIEAGRLFGLDLSHKTPEEMLPILQRESEKAGIKSMVLTMGSQGAVYVDHISGESGHCPGLPVNMVDSTGAGDAFFTGTVGALSRGWRLSNAVQAGAKLAAMTLEVAESCCPRAERLLEELEE